MEENKNKEFTDEQPVIQEQIIPKKNKNWKRFGRKLLRVAAYAAVFGVVAGVVFALTGSVLIKKLGLEDALRQVVDIGKTTQSSQETVTPGVTKPPVPTEGATATKTPTPPNTAKTTPGITVAVGNNKTENPSGGLNGEETVQGFLNMYSGIATLSGELEKSLVQITAVTEGVDWFEEAYETVGNATGLYVGDNGLDMLFLVNLDSIEGATKFRITFANGETMPCTIFSYDTNYRLAVLTVRLSAVAGMEEESLPVKATFALNETEVGTPVLVLGNPNGHLGAMELGMITGTGQVAQVVDDEVVYFTTGITEYADGDGFVFNLSGEVIGIVSKSLNKGEKGIITAVAVSGMRGTIERTLNNIPRIYCGMRLETVDTATGGTYDLPEGAYVTEVLTGSPAMNAGIKNGDIITTVGISPVNGARQFYEEISSVGPQSVRIIVSRDVKGERKDQTLFMTPETRQH